MNQFLSKKISFFSCLGTFMVLLMHSQDKNGCLYETTSWLYFIIIDLFSDSAVPIFFIISGLLFFKEKDITIKGIKNKIRKRYFSLGVPFLCATFFYICFFIFLYFIPSIGKYINGNIFEELNSNIFKIINRCFFNYPQMPIAGQLWYLRDLLIIVTCSPVLMLIFKNRYKYVFIVCLFLIASVYNTLSLWSSFFWFSLGGIIQSSKPYLVLNKTDSKSFLLCLGLYWITLIVIHAQGIIIPYYFGLSLLLIRIILMWYSYDLLNCKLIDKFVPKLSPYVFFIFLFHQPDINIIRKIPIILMGTTDVSYLLSFVITPFGCGVILLLIAMVLKKNFKSFYSFIIGGR